MLKKIFFLLIVGCFLILNLATAQETFTLDKNAKNAKILPFEYNGENDGFVIYSYEKKNGAFNYTFNIFDKNLKKIVSKKNLITKGTKLLEVTSNKNTFCFITVNEDKKTIDLFTFDKKGKRIGKRAITGDKLKRITKIIYDKIDINAGLETKGMEAYFPKVIAADNGYLIVNQNYSEKDGFSIEKTNDKLRKEWIKEVLPEEKELVSFGSIKKEGDKVFVISKLKEKSKSRNYDLKLNVFEAKAKAPVFTYNLKDKDENALLPNKFLIEEDKSIIIAGTYYEDGKITDTNADGAFLLKLDESGSEEFLNLTSWEKDLKKFIKRKSRNTKMFEDLKFVCQDVIKNGKFYDVAIELYKTINKNMDIDFDEEEEETDKKSKKKSKKDVVYSKQVPFCKSLDILVKRNDATNGEVEEMFFIAKKYTDKQMENVLADDANFPFKIVGQYPDYFGFQYANKNTENPYLVYVEENDKEINFNKTVLNNFPKPATNKVELKNAALLKDADKYGIYPVDEQNFIVHTFNESENTFIFWLADVNRNEETMRMEAEKMAKQKREKAIKAAKAKAAKEAKLKEAKEEGKSEKNTTMKDGDMKNSLEKKAAMKEKEMKEKDVKEKMEEMLKEKVEEKMTKKAANSTNKNVVNKAEAAALRKQKLLEALKKKREERNATQKDN